MTRIPYGISNYELLIREHYTYIDRTMYIEQLEQLVDRYIFFVRPRRFGKSLFISVLQYYYGIEHKDKFQKLFGQQYIGKNSTPSANSYLVLKMDFSSIATSSFEDTFQSFLNKVKKDIKEFFIQYPNFFTQKDIDHLESFTFPADAIGHLFFSVKQKAPNHKIYLLIDEYDHFANEILSFRFNEFSRMIGMNGFVRKFYEALKIETQSGLIDRLFITGIAPITLDSLTSGFNMSTNITLEEEFNEMLGFTESEVITILKGVGVLDSELKQTLSAVRAWYDGYLFGEEATEKIYNSDMVLYFAKEYNKKKRYPKILLDPNIASDYNKIRKYFKIKNKEKEHFKYLDELLKQGRIDAKLVREYDLVRKFDKHDFISLLFYTGIVTVERSKLQYVTFRMPNYVIKQLYYQYFHRLLLERSQLVGGEVDVFDLIMTLALDNDLLPLIKYTEAILSELAVRDKMRFDEKRIKIIFTSAFYNAGIYTIHNEFEVKKANSQKGFIDLLLVKRPPYQPNHNFVVELKYLKKADADKTKIVKEQAVIQLTEYLENDDYLQKLEDLRAYVVLFVGNKGELVKLDIKRN